MSTLTTQQVTTTFLLTGPTLQFDIPSSMRELPELSSPIDIGGSTGRSLDFFRTTPGDGFPESDFVHLAPVTGADDRTVAVRQRIEEPVHWFLVWTLANGTLVTHAREEDGLTLARMVAGHITVVEHSGRPPSVLLSHPLSHMISRRPGYHEEILYLEERDEPSALIRLRRPGALRNGERRVGGQLADNHTVGSALGIDISVGGEIYQQEAFEIAETVREGIEASYQARTNPDRNRAE